MVAGGYSGATTTTLLGGMPREGTVFAIVDALADAIAALEWGMWRVGRSGLEGDRTPVPGHAALDCWNRPNPHWLGSAWRESAQQHYELVGESWAVVHRVAGLPMEVWPVRPDRIVPAPSARKYLAGYVYLGPDGEKVPLKLDEVLRPLYRPNPDDPYRGIGALQSVLVDVDSSRYSAEWNRNFFTNSAEPGGIIEIPQGLTLEDHDFEQLRRRWNMQHRGVAQAHRVAILEHGKWVDRKITQRDMQFAELRDVSSEVIRRAWRFPKPLLGTVADVNRATAEAMDTIYARWMILPRARKWREFANESFLPMWPSAAAGGLRLDFVSPVPEDRESDRADLSARAAAAKLLIDAGFAPAEVCETVGLPAMALTTPAEPERVAAAVEAMAAMVSAEVGSLRETVALASTGGREVLALPARPAAAGDVPAGLADMAAVQAEWESALAALLEVWRSRILPDQYASLEDQVRASIEAGDVAGLAALAVDTSAAGDELSTALGTLARASAATVTAEAAGQGVTEADDAVPAVDVAPLAAVAVVVAAGLGAGLALAAGGEALRLIGGDATATEVASGVRAHLDALTDAQPRQRIGGALSTAQHAGRVAAFKSLPRATYWATEELDANTCGPCGKIHARQWARLENATKEYPVSGYRKCEGGSRCRGQLVAQWGNET
jgi:HK97 family phage portal protein